MTSLDDLPVTWASASLANLCIDIKQRTPAPDEQFTYIDIASIDRDLKQIKEPQILIGQAAPSRARKIIEANDVLVSMTRPNLNAVALVQDDFFNPIASTGFDVLRTNLIEPKWLYFHVRSQKFIETLLDKVQGALYPAVKSSDIRSYEIPIPPLAEQQEIATRLDDLLAQVDTIKARLDALPVILKRFRQAVLAAAVSGKLTEDWRAINSTGLTNLKNEISKDRKDKLGKRYKSPLEINEEKCFELPQSWFWSNLSELTWSIKDGPHYSPEYSASGIPFISGGNIRPEGISFSNIKYISEALHKELSKRCRPELGDILYTKGGTTGIAYYNLEEREFNVWVHVAVLKLVSNISGMYLQHALNSQHCYQQSQEYTHGVGNQDLGLTRMIKITVPVPPLPEQTEIINRVEQLFAFADQIEQQVQAAQTRVKQLTQAILAKAFKGELTADWRAAHPELISGEHSAEALLEKIKATQIPNKPKRGKAKQGELNL